MPPKTASSSTKATPPSPTLPPFLLTSPQAAPPPSLARLQALYASTSAQRLSNSTGYAANATWWAEAVQESLRSGWIGGAERDRLVLKVDEELVGKFDWDGKRPRGLGGVVVSSIFLGAAGAVRDWVTDVQERESTSVPPKLHPLAAFLSSPTPLHAPASATRRFIGRPLYWAFSQLNLFGGEREVKEEDLWKAYGKGREYAHVPLVEAAAAKFVAHMDEAPVLHYTDSLYDIDNFRKAFGRVCIPDPPSASTKGSRQDLAAEGEDEDGGRLSKRDVTVLVKWLMRDMGVVVSDGTIIKVLQPDETVPENPITEVDRGVVSVLNALEKVEAQITSIEKQIAQCQAKAKTHLAASQRQLAMSQLRSKKALDEILVRRVGVSEQLRGAVRSIDEAQNDVDVMRAYETSTSSLKTLLANPLLSPDRVERTTEDLAEALASQREVDDAIRIGGAVAVGNTGVEEIDEGELEKELEGLVEEEKAKKDRADAEAAREQKERKEKEEKTKAEEERRRLAAVPSTQAAPMAESALKLPANPQAQQPPPAQPVRATMTEDEWEKRYDAAQVREKEERARADAERLKREEKRAMEAT